MAVTTDAEPRFRWPAAARLRFKLAEATTAVVSWPEASGAAIGYQVTANGFPLDTVDGRSATVGGLLGSREYVVAVQVVYDSEVHGLLTLILTPPVGFADVADSSIFALAIRWLATAGITGGYDADGGRFCPSAPFTRGQMATFLTRTLDLPAAGTQPFTDVSGTHASGIAALSAAGITGGCDADGGRFCPSSPVTRAQMAAFLQRGLSG